MQLKCPGNKLHGLVVEGTDQKPQGLIEFRCGSKFCGKKDGTIILHRFDLSTGECETRRYLEPPKLQEGQ